MTLSTAQRLTILGMSGVGKTHISALLAGAGWRHYSSDYRIGAHYLKSEILKDLTHHITADPEIMPLIEDGTLEIDGRITIENLHLLSRFVGKIGNPEEGGLSEREFRRRQELYNQAEQRAVADVKDFIPSDDKTHFIHDSSGSLCEMPTRLLEDLASRTFFVYIEATREDEEMLLERAETYPKPLFYPADFLTQALEEYKKDHHLEYTALISPDAFCRWVFPRLFYSRLPKYKELADLYGVTISSRDVRAIKSESDFLDLIGTGFDKKQRL